MVLSATPIDINRVVKVKKPVMRVGYELQEIGDPTITEIIEDFTKKSLKKTSKKTTKKTTRKRKK
jgi:predicted GTPase